MAPNKTLKGHKLVILTPWGPPVDFLDRLQKEYPDLKAEYHKRDWIDIALPSVADEGYWKDVTILLTFQTLPTPEQAPNLEYVQLMSAGANHILDNPLFKDTDVNFCTANGVHGPQISEWVISTYLSFSHHLPEYWDKQKEGRWQRGNMNVEDSYGKTVGILGYGSIGRQVARVSVAMGMKVHAYTLHPRPTPESRRDESWTPEGLGDPEGVLPSKWFSGETTEKLHEFLASGLDLLLISTPLTDNTRHLISAPEFKVLAAQKRTALVSNIGRGPIIHTDDLISALNEGLIGGAALDVTDPEPLPANHPLWNTKNVIITPHISGASVAYNQRVLAILEYNLKRFSEGKELTNRVNRKEGY
ncbi:D-2-hydroxyacid dehydrogenase [Diplogelasinospora grovesii]|uniref:D-2-hydroxyacid dehydrogenase n=1 Tax=Diplogelasinospora grovesii TaxID=303347 RepID=A0AAN6S811_9PEZI|nr:D-2-hydroxyacid dehydrogenase [Diplogelasinospora grovesii]